MRIFFIISEDKFYKPQFIEKIIRQRKKDIVGIAVISSRNPKYTFFDYVGMYLNLFGIWNFIVLSLKEVYYTMLDKLSSFMPTKRLYSVKKVALKHDIPLYQPKNVNNSKFLEQLRELKPDIIVSSCVQIFKKELLTLPKIACINRHTALLPQYGGVWPVFWAMLNDEERIGVTIHTMTEKVDEGKIITQGIIDVKKEHSMSDIYRKGLDLSADLVLEALDIIENKKKFKVLNKNRKPSYYSFPIRKDVKKFLRKGYKLV